MPLLCNYRGNLPCFCSFGGVFGYAREVVGVIPVYPAILPLVKLYCRLSLFACFGGREVVGLYI